MGKTIISISGGSGGNSDECTATRGDVLKGKTAVTSDSDDEIIAGTLELTGNASDDKVLNGSTYYNTDAKTKRTGTIPIRNDNPTSARLLAEEGKIKMVPPKGYYDGSSYYTWDTQALVAEKGGLTAAKILAGQSAFGIGGTATNDSDAVAGNILTTKTAYVKGKKITGTMPNQGAKTSALNCGGSYTIPAGYHNGSGKVTANSLASQTSATSGAGDIRSGKTGWVNGAKLTGTLAVTSAISFSSAALSYNTIRISWTNPSKGPWQGVFIQMSTSGYPGTGGGSRAYTGAGNNPNQAGGANYVDIGGLSPGTTYYFTCTSYCDNLGWGASHNVSVKTKLIDLRDAFNVEGVSRYIVIPYMDSYESHEETYYYNRYMRSDYVLGENLITTSSFVENDKTWGSWRDGDPMQLYLKYSANVEPPANVITALQQYKNYHLLAKTHINVPESYARTYTGTVTISWTKLSGGGLNNSGYWILFTLNRAVDNMVYDLLYYELTLLP